jgi:uncharacterized membrane protein YfcA
MEPATLVLLTAGGGLIGFLLSVLGAGGLILQLAIQGVLVGLLTGIAGVGGGFAIVPALVLLAGLPMQLVCGISLLLIVVNALVALLALGHWPQSLRQGFAALLIGSALLSGSEAPRRQFNLQTGGNSPGNKAPGGAPG